jgi:MoaA/NifB/PqqE/SkfB family radical SAM enzyme
VTSLGMLGDLGSDYRECCFSAGRTLILRLTNSCNQMCQHCMRDSRPMPLVPIDVSALGAAMSDHVRRVQPNRVVISGGEPTLIPSLPSIIAAIHALGVRVSVCTNATLVTQTRALAYRRAGLSAATVGAEGVGVQYERVRGVRGSFARATAGIGALSRAGVAVTVNITFHAGLLATLDETAAWLSNLTLLQVSVTSPIVQGRLLRLGFTSDFGSTTRVEQFGGYVRALGRLIDCPVAARVPRCDLPSCPSGNSVFFVNHLGEIEGCPDVGCTNALDLDSRLATSS